MNKLIISSLLVACTSQSNYPYINNPPPVEDAGVVVTDGPPGPTLWSDADTILSTALCDLEARCGYDLFAFSFGSGSAAMAACIQLYYDELCYGQWEGIALCNGLYPTKHLSYLAACPDDSGSADCNSAWDDSAWVQSCNIASPWSQ